MHVLRSALGFARALRPFATLKMFEPMKKPAELASVFKLPKREPGHMMLRKRIPGSSQKKSLYVRPKKYKLKDHTGLRDRVRVRGPLRLRRFKFMSAGKRHLNRHKSRANLLRKGRARYICKSDMWRVKRMLPSHRKNTFKRRQ